MNDPVIGTNVVTEKTDTTFKHITALEPEADTLLAYHTHQTQYTLQVVSRQSQLVILQKLLFFTKI